jgi:hypothetical protein
MTAPADSPSTAIRGADLVDLEQSPAPVAILDLLCARAGRRDAPTVLVTKPLTGSPS